MAEKIGFLDVENVFGQQLLSLVARGSTIIAELQRLGKHIPEPYQRKNTYEKQKYKDLLFSFDYFKNIEAYDNQIRNNVDLNDLDDEFSDSYSDILERFYYLYLSIYNYIDDYSKLVRDLESGIYIQFNLEVLLQDLDGKRLICEGLYLYGVMLLLLDRLMPSPVREPIIVSYYRYRGQSTISKINEICKILAGTNYEQGDKRPQHYPLQYFSRFPIDNNFVRTLVYAIKDDDIYEQVKCYPSNEHRSVALSNQASVLFLLLYFEGRILSDNYDTMREIISKHFNDNFVIPIYQGFIVDVGQYYEFFKAAGKAITTTVSLERITNLSAKHLQAVPKLNKDLKNEAKEGVITEKYVLDKKQDLLNLMRRANVTIRWILLHRFVVNKKMKEIILANQDDDQFLTLILRTSEFEVQFKDVLYQLFEKKQELLESDKLKAVEEMVECGEYFAGNRNLGKVVKDEAYEQWFKTIAAQINELNFKHSSSTQRKILSFIQALENISVYPYIDTNPQIRFFVLETIDILKHMGQISLIRKQDLVSFSLISDFSYAWNLLDSFLDVMHKSIKRNSNNVLLLRSCFLKLASIMNLPLVRIIQSNTPDLMNVSQFYSNELVQFVARVLSIIPRSIFELLKNIRELVTPKMRAQEAKIQKEELIEYALLNERFQLAEYSHRISLFAQGMLHMDKCLMGIIEVDPREFLINGIRNQLVENISRFLHKGFVFKLGSTEEFERVVSTLGTKLDALRQGLEYIQDFIGIQALKMWKEESSRLIIFNVKREGDTKKLIREKLEEEISDNRNQALIQIPSYEPLDHESNTFMGRLINGIINITKSSKNVFYLLPTNSWYTDKGDVAFSSKTLSYLIPAIGQVGVNGLDMLISYNIQKELNKFNRMYYRAISSDVKQILDRFVKDLVDTMTFNEQTKLNFDNLLLSLKNVYNTLTPIITKIGHFQLIRRVLLQEQSFISKVDSKGLQQTVENINKSIILKLTDPHKAKNEDEYDVQKETELKELEYMEEISKFSDMLGISNPFNKIYTIFKYEVPFYSIILSIIVIGTIPAFVFNTRYCSIMKRSKNEPIDGQMLMAGIITVLHHAHSNYIKEFLSLLSQYVKASIFRTFHGQVKAPKELPQQTMTLMAFLEEFCKYAQLPAEFVQKYMSAFFFASFPH